MSYLSCRDYEAAAEGVPEAFGLKRSSVSRSFIRSSARQLRHLHERPLGNEKWLVLLLDGKTFRDSLGTALGVTATGGGLAPFAVSAQHRQAV